MLKIILMLFMLTNIIFGKVLNVTITAYTSRVSECEGNPFITATGYKLSKKDYRKTVAVSRDLFKTLKNKYIVLEFNNKKIKVFVNDTMNKRFRNRVDLYHWTKLKIARNFKYKGKIIY